MLKVSAFFKKSRIRSSKDEGKEILGFWAKFFVSPTGSRHLGELKTSSNDEICWPSIYFSEMVNGHFLPVSWIFTQFSIFLSLYLFGLKIKEFQCVQQLYNVYNSCTMCTMCTTAVQCVQCVQQLYNVYNSCTFKFRHSPFKV